MKITKLGRAALIAGVGSILLASCAANEGTSGGEPVEGGVTGTIEATGASSQTAAQEAWVAAFLEANPESDVIYEPTGSGVGRDNFLAGASNFIGSDRAFNEEEVAAGGFGSCTTDDIIEIPVYISPVAVIFNIDGVDSLNLDAATIAGLFAGTITNWNDPAIADQNPDADLPDTAITPVHRSDDSGTTKNFTDYLGKASSSWSYEAEDAFPVKGGEAAEGTSGVISAVSGGTGTIGYADESQVGDLSVVSVKVGEEYVAPSAEGAAIVVETSPAAEGRADVDMAVDIDRTSTEAGAYPVVLLSYLIACQTYEDQAEADLVKGYLSYIVSDEGQQAAADEAGSAPLSSSVAERAQSIVDAITAG